VEANVSVKSVDFSPIFLRPPGDRPGRSPLSPAFPVNIGDVVKEDSTVTQRAIKYVIRIFRLAKTRTLMADVLTIAANLRTTLVVFT
jgi:hypothetical protein